MGMGAAGMQHTRVSTSQKILMNIVKLAWMVALFLFPYISLSAGTTNTVIVLDASNSMWGQIDGKSKIEIARDNLAQLLQTPAAPQSITLITYGSQHKSDCQDIAVQQASTPAELLQQASSIMPKGRSPISAAITQAATRGNHILLVSDGQESCDADPCAAAKQLKASNPELRIHVLGFRDDPASQLRCIAEHTGGTFALAGDTAALAKLLETPVANATTTTPAIPADTPGTLQLTLGAGNSLDNLPASFLLYDARGEHLNTFTTRKEISRQLPPGQYRVDVLWGQLKLSETLQVTAGQTTTHRFDLGGMGKLVLDAIDSRQNPLDANFTLYTRDGNFLSDRLLKSSITEQLPAGSYRIKAVRNRQSQEATLEVAADGESRHTFVFGQAD